MLIKTEPAEYDALPEARADEDGPAVSGPVADDIDPNVDPPPKIELEDLEEEESNDEEPNAADVNSPQWMEDEMSRLRNYVRDLRDVQQEFKNVWPTRAQEWRETAASLIDADLPVLRVAVYGASGSGKSTLINCLINRNLLPADGEGHAVTSFVSKVVYSSSEIPTGRVEFIKLEDWIAEIEAFVAALPELGVEGTKLEDKRTWNKLEAVYPGVEDMFSDGTTVDDILALDQGLRRCLGATVRFSGEDADALSLALRTEVRRLSHPDLDPMDIDGPEPDFWPLVQLAVYGCDSDILLELELTDFPGTGDVNAARSQMALDYLAHADHILITSLASRACDNDAYSGLFNSASPVSTGIKQIITTQGDNALRYAKARQGDDDEIKKVKDLYRGLQTQIDRLDRAIKKATKAESRLVSTDTRKRRRPSPHGAESSSKRRHTSGSFDLGRSMDTATGDDAESHEEYVDGLQKQFRDLLEQQIPIRPMIHRLAAVERLENIEQVWPRQFAHAISALTGDDHDNRSLPVAICTSVVTYRVIQHDPGWAPIRGRDEAGIVTLHNRLHELVVQHRRKALRLYMERVRSHTLHIRSFLDSTSMFRVGLPNEEERYDMCIARLKIKLSSASLEESILGDRGICTQAYAGFEHIANQFGVELTGAFLQALADRIHEASDNAAHRCEETYRTLGDLLRWNTFLAVMRRDGAFRGDWNKSFVAPIRDDIALPWAQVFAQENPTRLNSRIRRELTDHVSDALQSARKLATQDAEMRALKVAWKVKEFAKRAEDNAKLAILAALEAAQTELNEGQKVITRDMAAKLKAGLRDAYASSRTTPRGDGFMKRMKGSFLEQLNLLAPAAFPMVADGTMADLERLVAKVTSELRIALRACAAKMESDVAILWTEVPVEKSEIVMRNLAFQHVTNTLHHIDRSPLHADFLTPTPSVSAS
ncbi:unnamed protein product [Peniophora sp. CBMAI 1063]|nr:unnamed protein product [Peniophora sp. CBMAI 1063]